MVSSKRYQQPAWIINSYCSCCGGTLLIRAQPGNTLCYDWLMQGQCLKRPRSNIQQQLVAAVRVLHMLLCDRGAGVTAGRDLMSCLCCCQAKQFIGSTKHKDNWLLTDGHMAMRGRRFKRKSPCSFQWNQKNTQNENAMQCHLAKRFCAQSNMCKRKTVLDWNIIWLTNIYGWVWIMETCLIMFFKVSQSFEISGKPKIFQSFKVLAWKLLHIMNTMQLSIPDFLKKPSKEMFYHGL